MGIFKAISSKNDSKEIKMENFINQLEINNFKSIRHLNLSGFEKINLFIGRPNVGKSNILEALSVFSLPYLKVSSGKLPLKKIQNLIRIEHESELFYEGDSSKPIEIKTNLSNCVMYRNSLSEIFEHLDLLNTSLEKAFFISFSNNIEIKTPSLKSYRFKANVKFKKENLPFLMPPFGANILESLEYLPETKETISQWFNNYGLKIVFDKASQTLKILKETNDGQIFLIPYNSIADTLQRIIFYKTAIASNENSILIFEEPEAHAFPPYISEFTQEVIKSKTNQFFMATHSPIIVNDFLENAREDLSIFIVDFKEGQTIVKSLSRNEIEEVYRYGVDLFFNNEAYLA